jgi:hypothetical protein
MFTDDESTEKAGVWHVPGPNFGAVNKVREVSAGAGARLHPDYCLSSAWLLFWGVAQKLLVVVSHLQRLMVTDGFVF